MKRDAKKGKEPETIGKNISDEQMQVLFEDSVGDVLQERIEETKKKFDDKVREIPEHLRENVIRRMRELIRAGAKDKAIRRTIKKEFKIVIEIRK